MVCGMVWAVAASRHGSFICIKRLFHMYKAPITGILMTMELLSVGEGGLNGFFTALIDGLLHNP